MACASCQNNRKYNQESLNKIQATKSDPFIFNATDIQVYHQGESHRFTADDWNNDKHKLILFFPKTFTPVCQTEMGALNDWLPEFEKLNCEVYGATADPIHLVQSWYESDDILATAQYKVLSSYQLPSKLSLMHNGTVRRSSVFVMNDGEIVKQEHFEKVGRSLAELHRMLFGFSTDSYCAEGWQNPNDGFLTPPDTE